MRSLRRAVQTIALIFFALCGLHLLPTTMTAQEPLTRRPVVAKRIDDASTRPTIEVQVERIPRDAPVADPGRLAEFKLSARGPYLENHAYLTVVGLLSPSENRITLVGADAHSMTVFVFVDAGRRYLVEMHADSRYPPSSYRVYAGQQAQSLTVEARAEEPVLFGFTPATSGLVGVHIQPVGQSIIDFRGDITVRQVDRLNP